MRKAQGHFTSVQTLWLPAGTRPDRAQRPDRQSQTNIPTMATDGPLFAQKKTEEKAKNKGSDPHVSRMSQPCLEL